MENINCPLCSTIQDKNNAIEILSAETLIKFWRVSFSINISTFIKEKNIKYFCCSQCELGFFHPYAGGDDTFYNKLSKLDWYYLHADKTEYFYTKKLLDKKMKVLDIGCGRGVFATYI